MIREALDRTTSLCGLFRYGEATKVQTRHSVAAKKHDRSQRFAAKQALRHPPIEITGVQAVSVVEGFRQACEEGGYNIYACAVLPEHIHLVIGWHRRNIRKIVGHLKSNATRRLKEDGLWNFGNRTMWGAHGWNVYLDDIAAVKRAIRYVERNPVKEGKKPQRWSIVTPFDYGGCAKERVASDAAKWESAALDLAASLATRSSVTPGDGSRPHGCE
jgi:REP element-mobilizing transposase RayT